MVLLYDSIVSHTGFLFLLRLFCFVLTLTHLILPDAYYSSISALSFLFTASEKKTCTHLYFFVTCALPKRSLRVFAPETPNYEKKQNESGRLLPPFTGLLHYGGQNVEHFHHFDPLVRCSISILRREDTLLRWTRSNRCPSQAFSATLNFEIAIGNSSKLKVYLAR